MKATPGESFYQSFIWLYSFSKQDQKKFCLEMNLLAPIIFIFMLENENLLQGEIFRETLVAVCVVSPCTSLVCCSVFG